MRPQKIVDKDLLIALTSVFRARGYEGASLKELSEATGLKKASLYHRFPNGKQEMAESVFNYMAQWVEENIFFALNDESFSPEVRLKNGLAQIRTLYAGGKEICILRALSMQAGMDLFEQNISIGLNKWINAFTEVGTALQLSPELAKEKATQTLIEIQGSLILSRGLNDITIFEKSLQNIENRYLKT